MLLICLLAQADDGRDLFLPDSAGEGIVWGLLLVMLAGLWWVVRRSRRHAEDEFWDRKRREQNEGPPDTD